MLTTTQAALHLGLAPAYLRSLLAAGKGPASIRQGGKGPGGSHRFEIEELDRWQSTRTRIVRAPAQPARLGPDWTWPARART